MSRTTTFEQDLKKKLKDKEFKALYARELAKLRLGRQISRLRKRLRLTQTELAKKMRTSQGAVTRLESGSYTGYTLGTLQRIAQATGARLDIRLRF